MHARNEDHGISLTHSFHYWRRAEAHAAAGFAVFDFDPWFIGCSDGEPRQMVSVRHCQNSWRFIRASAGDYRNQVTTWEVLGSLVYRPGRRLKDVSCPVLLASGVLRHFGRT